MYHRCCEGELKSRVEGWEDVPAAPVLVVVELGGLLIHNEKEYGPSLARLSRGET